MTYIRMLVIALLLSVVSGAVLAQGYCPAQTPVATKHTGTSYTIAQGDYCNVSVFTSSSAIAVSLPAPGTAGGFLPGFQTTIFALGSGTPTITPTAPATGGSAPTINSASSFAVTPTDAVIIVLGTDGNWYAY